MRRCSTLAIALFATMALLVNPYSPRNARACWVPCPNAVTAPNSWMTAINTVYNYANNIVQRMMATERTIQTALEFYYFVQSVRFMQWGGLLQDISNVTGIASNAVALGGMGLNTYNDILTNIVGTQSGTVNPKVLSDAMQQAAAWSQSLGDLSAGASSLQMLSQTNNGNGFLAMANGSQLVAGSVAQVGMGVSHILGYYLTRDRMHAQQNALRQIAEEQKATTVNLAYEMPCIDEPAFVDTSNVSSALLAMQNANTCPVSYGSQPVLAGEPYGSNLPMQFYTQNQLAATQAVINANMHLAPGQTPLTNVSSLMPASSPIQPPLQAGNLNISTIQEPAMPTLSFAGSGGP